MVNPLALAHAILGELGILAFLWAFVELLQPTKDRINRAKIASLTGLVLFVATWIVGGYYYVNIYSTQVKPIIKKGPMSWAHGIVMETKEHVFLFLPFIAILQYFVLRKYDLNLINSKNAKISVLILLGILILGGLSMAFTGSIISAGARAALEILK